VRYMLWMLDALQGEAAAGLFKELGLD
jgi:hypothetical protein